MIFAALLVASCSNDEPAPSGAGAIRFAAGAAASRDGAGGNNVDFTSFILYGWQMRPTDQSPDSQEHNVLLFNAQAVNSQQGQWVYSPLQYWFKGYDYHFEAFAHLFAETLTNPQSGLTINPPAQYRDELTVQFDASRSQYAEDLMHASTDRSTTTGIELDAVDFRFTHALARLKLCVKPAQIAGYHLRLGSLTFTPACKSASFLSAPVFTTTTIPPTRRGGEPITITTSQVEIHVVENTKISTDVPSLTLVQNTPAVTVAQLYTSRYLYLIPGAVGTITVNYEIWDDGQGDAPAGLIRSDTNTYTVNGSMLAGHSYQATIYIPSSSQVISIEGALDPWGADNPTDREILSI